jgi:hypothetical protein
MIARLKQKIYGKMKGENLATITVSKGRVAFTL